LHQFFPPFFEFCLGGRGWQGFALGLPGKALHLVFNKKKGLIRLNPTTSRCSDRDSKSRVEPAQLDFFPRKFELRWLKSPFPQKFAGGFIDKTVRMFQTNFRKTRLQPTQGEFSEENQTFETNPSGIG